jgi:O-antigen/teichoic acid export membrane protein
MGNSDKITMQRPKSIASNAVWSLSLTAWQTVIGFFYTPFLIHYIGPDLYGLFILLMSIAGLLGIMNLGLGEATLRYVAYYNGRNDLTGINRVVGSTLLIYIIVGTFAGLLIFFASPWLVKFIAIPDKLYNLGVKLLKLTAINFSIRLIGGAIEAIPQALQRYDISTKVSIGESIFQVTGTVVIVLTGFGIYEIVLWSVITTLMTRIINYIVAKYLIKEIRIYPSLSRDGLKEVFSYGIFSFITQMLGTIWGQLDKILLGTLVNASSVAYLTVPQNLAFRGSYAVGNAGSALFPKFSAIKDQKEISNLYLNSTWLLLCATITIFVPLTVLFPDFLRLWINPEFALFSGWVGQIIACSCIVRGAFVPYDALFKGLGKPQYLTVLYFCSGVTSLVANIILIPRYGLDGAGYCYCLTIFYGFAAILFAWKKVLVMDNMRPLIRSVILPIIASIILLFVFALIRYNIGQPGWTGLISMGFLFLTSSCFILIGIEKILGGDKSHANMILKYITKIVRMRELNIFSVKR